MTDTTTLSLLADFTPLSGLTLRDARPFQAGDSTTSFNLPFPPPPAAFWSAARAVVRPKDRAAGDNSPGLRLHARGFALADAAGTLYLPVPLDLPTEHPDEKLLPVGPNDALLASYLLGEFDSQAAPQDLPRVRTFYQTDRRVGVRLEDRKTLQSGGLYSEDVLYLDPSRGLHFRLALEAAGPVGNAPFGRGSVAESVTEIVRLGGESRCAALRLSAGDLSAWFPAALRDRILQRILEQPGPPYRVKITLFTHAVCAARMGLLSSTRPDPPAWKPPWMPLALTEPPFPARYKIRLERAFAGKPIPLGFWDRARQSEAKDRVLGGPGLPKPLYRCLPPGAVYFLELHPRQATPEQALGDFFARFWLRTALVRGYDNRRARRPGAIDPHAGKPTFFGKMGFGWSLLGAWNYVKSVSQ
jgi:hypothetical protein